MSGFSAHQAEAVACIDDQRRRFSDFNLKIWNFAEPAWREYKSVRAYIDLLRADGWEVEESSGGMPTAFAATWSRDRGGPVLGSYAEYDAVPGNSQQIVPRRAPREGLHPWTAGHTDPHSQLGTTSLVGMLATKAVMERHNIPGTLRFFGEIDEALARDLDHELGEIIEAPFEIRLSGAGRSPSPMSSIRRAKA